MSSYPTTGMKFYLGSFTGCDGGRGMISLNVNPKILLAMWSCRYLALIIILAASAGCTSLTSPITSEKQIRREIKTDYSVRDPEFRASISPLLGAPLVDGNKVVELQNGDQIFPAMLEGIRAAQKTITIESFIWSSGEVSKQFVEALSERARAGVKVHVLVDAVGSWRLKRRDRNRMTGAGVRFARVNPVISIRFFRFNHRTHRKLLVVDGKVGFIGGVCLSDDWSGNAERGKWRDTHYRVEGPVVAQMQGAFSENWLGTRSEILEGRDYFPVLQPVGSMTAQCFSSGPRDHAEQARLSYLLAMAAAQKSIRLAHAYFVPSKLAIRTLLDARKRGVNVEIIIPAKIDNFAVHMASRSRLRKLLEAGVRFYEYTPTLYHCKIMIVDDCWATIGSVNFDEKSFRANDEANLNVLSTDFAATLIKTFNDDKAKSRLLTKEDFKRRSIFSKTANFFVGLFHADL
jgi:cardiolipin synthase A/B